MEFPGQFRKGIEVSDKIKTDGSFRGVIVSGMGGSALPGLLLNDYLRGRLKITVNMDYSLPEDTENHLAFISSYSGNTEETLNAYREALGRGMKMLGFCSGGKLEELCRRDRIPFVKYPREKDGFQPRFGLGYAFSSMLNVLSNSGLIPNQKKEITKTADSLKGTDVGERARMIAKGISGKIPVIYTSERIKSVGYVWKISLNENPKVMAFSNVFPELNHNEITGYTDSKGRFLTIILEDAEDLPEIKKRMELTSELIESMGGRIERIRLEGSLLERMLYAVYLGMWVSYYLALEKGIDPLPINMQEAFKERLAQTANRKTI